MRLKIARKFAEKSVGDFLKFARKNKSSTQIRSAEPQDQQIHHLDHCRCDIDCALARGPIIATLVREDARRISVGAQEVSRIRTEKRTKTFLLHKLFEPVGVRPKSLCSEGLGRADIEGSKSNIAMNAWLPQASYPCGNFCDTSS